MSSPPGVGASSDPGACPPEQAPLSFEHRQSKGLATVVNHHKMFDSQGLGIMKITPKRGNIQLSHDEVLVLKDLNLGFRAVARTFFPSRSRFDVPSIHVIQTIQTPQVAEPRCVVWTRPTGS